MQPPRAAEVAPLDHCADVAVQMPERRPLATVSSASLEDGAKGHAASSSRQQRKRHVPARMREAME